MIMQETYQHIRRQVALELDSGLALQSVERAFLELPEEFRQQNEAQLELIRQTLARLQDPMTERFRGVSDRVRLAMDQALEKQAKRTGLLGRGTRLLARGARRFGFTGARLERLATWLSPPTPVTNPKILERAAKEAMLDAKVPGKVAKGILKAVEKQGHVGNFNLGSAEARATLEQEMNAAVEEIGTRYAKRRRRYSRVAVSVLSEPVTGRLTIGSIRWLGRQAARPFRPLVPYANGLWNAWRGSVSPLRVATSPFRFVREVAVGGHTSGASIAQDPALRVEPDFTPLLRDRSSELPEQGAPPSAAVAEPAPAAEERQTVEAKAPAHVGPLVKWLYTDPSLRAELSRLSPQARRALLEAKLAEFDRLSPEQQGELRALVSQGKARAFGSRVISVEGVRQTLREKGLLARERAAPPAMRGVREEVGGEPKAPRGRGRGNGPKAPLPILPAR